ncbi:MAG: carbamoyltransferase HypF [Sporolactobacillus sp.]
MRGAVEVIVRGRVQGVGFRPFIYRLAAERDVAGTVQNNMDGVHIFWEGEREVLKAQIARIRREAPPLARIDDMTVRWIPTRGLTDFNIVASDLSGQSTLVIPVDAATCDDCLREMRDPANFRYRYPFINCTQCGPRYTIIEGLPYDRPLTVMKDFQTCPHCKAEYDDPLNRRHHAQPIACPSCGPHCSFLDGDGQLIAERDDAVKACVSALEGAAIVAIKGIGGYHLACNASDAAAVERLRRRKHRPGKPLAVMARDVAAVRCIAEMSEAEEKVLLSPAAPIVLLRKRKAAGERLAAAVAPGVATLGVMLPYAPLHHLLFDDGSYDFLVMTSANPSGLPMLYETATARTYLAGIADYFLDHDRTILHPVDDSVVRVSDAVPFFLRRSRGYVPDPITVGAAVDGIVALGSQMKNTFAIGRAKQVIIGPHLGDLDAEESLTHYEQTLHHLLHWTGITVQMVARDAHPLFSTRPLAETFGCQVIDVQHHHAHHVSCMVDNGLTAPCLGLILDGTGYGEDGTIWGFELLYGDAHVYRRLAHLKPAPLPGGDAAVREPWRAAAGLLIDCFGSEGERFAAALFPEYAAKLPVLAAMVRRRVNAPLAGTCGRLFDAVSAVLGICRKADYDGQAAIELEDCCIGESAAVPAYPYTLENGGALQTIDFSPMIRRIVSEHLNGITNACIAARFHETVAEACCRVLTAAVDIEPELGKTVVLSGGSMNNKRLAARLEQLLGEHGFIVHRHHRFPAGDGGLSVGQLMIAAAHNC